MTNALLPGSATRARGPAVSPAAPLLRAQEQALSHNERIETLTLRAVKEKAGIDVAGSLTGARVTLTIEGASTLELDIFDPEWKLETSSLLDKDENGRMDAVVCMLDGLRWRLAKAARQGDTLTLTFEDEVWALMRAHRSHVAVSRNSMTRAQFIERRLIREIKLRDVPYFAPEKGRKQPQELPDFPDARPAAHSTGFDKGAKFEIAGAKADAAQMREVATAMKVADQLDVPQESVVRLAMLVAGVGESTFRAVMNRGGSPYGGVFQGKAKERGGPWDIKDTEGMTRSFLKGGKGFQAGGAIAAHRAHPDWSPGTIAYNVEGSRANFGSDAEAEHHYQQHIGEARRMMAAWGGSDSDGGQSGHEAVRVKSYRFTRGLPGQPENSAQCAIRLADEVAWRFFVVGGVAYFVNDYFLISRAADLVLEGFDAPGLLRRPSYEWDHRKLAASVTLDVSANAWGVRPGSVVACLDMGPISGRWIVETFEFDLFNSKQATVTLTKPTAPKKEPAPELFLVNVGDGTASGAEEAGVPGAGGAKKAIAWARSRIGHYAEEYGQNRGRELDQLEAQAPFNMRGQPWCAIFATTALVMGGVSRDCRTAAVAQIDAWAKAGTNGYQRGYRATPQPGDLMLFSPPNPNDHVGLVERVSGNSVTTIEGNTSASKVARNTRLKSTGVFVRPDYPDAD